MAGFKRFFQQRKVQLWLVPLIALLASNALGAAQLPFTEGYVFPTGFFLILYVITNLAWEAHIVAYRWLDRQLPFDLALKKRIYVQVLFSIGITFVVFSIIYLLYYAILNLSPTWNNYLRYLFLALCIAAAINLGFIIQGLRRAFEKTPPQYLNVSTPNITEEMPSKTPSQTILVASGSRLVQLGFDEILYFSSMSGIVKVVKTDQTQLTTNWSAFSNFSNDLPTNHFFQVNRQFIVHHQAIKTVKEDTNRKLNLTLKTDTIALTEPIVISRYRRNEFLEWFKGSVL
jgi:DNA-binding LytR/AlgR family response regulator